MSRVKALVALTLLASSAIGPVEAQSLRVMPVVADLAPGATGSVFTLETDSKEGVAAQVRVFRWSQVNGEDKLENTADVIISPPVLTVHGGTPSTVRLVRVAKTPVSGEETYRVVVDQIPDRRKLQAGAVAMMVRQILPVFFTGFDARPGSIAWKAVERNHSLFLEATNAGQKRVQITKLTVTDEKDQGALKGAGYVLGGQKKAWQLAKSAAGKTLTIKAESDMGPINASVIVGKGG